MIHDNSLRPSTLLGLVLLVLAVVGIVTWVGALLDADADAFDTPGLILLGLALVSGILSALFFARARWVRLTTSVLFHGLIVALAVVLLRFGSAEEGIGLRVFAGALFLLGAGMCVVGILSLHHSAMKADLSRAAESPEAAARRRSRARCILLGVLGVTLLALAYGAWRIVPLLIAKPTITVNYVSQYNEVTRPADYDPNLNAAPHYERLFAGLSELPKVLLAGGRWESWPGAMASEEREALERWAAENESLLEHLRQAARCPYWRTEFQSEDGSLDVARLSPHLTDQRRCIFALTALAQYQAYRGNVEGALDILVDLYTLGLHGTQKALLIDQLAGMGICERTCKTALTVLSQAQADAGTLREAGRAFSVTTALFQVPQFTAGEMIYALDGIQRMFTNDGSDDGRLIPKRLYDFSTEAASFNPPLSYAGAVWICLGHPSRRETVAAGQRLHETGQALTQRTPWEIFTDGTSYEDELGRVVKGNHFHRVDCPLLARVIALGWRGKATGRALVATLAVLAHRREKGQLPESLDELVAAGLLDSVPMDPCGEGALVYRATGDDFTLYSVGEDFFDDGGEPGGWDDFGTDRVFWPVTGEEGHDVTDDVGVD